MIIGIGELREERIKAKYVSGDPDDFLHFGITVKKNPRHSTKCFSSCFFFFYMQKTQNQIVNF